MKKRRSSRKARMCAGEGVISSIPFRGSTPTAKEGHHNCLKLVPIVSQGPTERSKSVRGIDRKKTSCCAKRAFGAISQQNVEECEGHRRGLLYRVKVLTRGHASMCRQRRSGGGILRKVRHRDWGEDRANSYLSLERRRGLKRPHKKNYNRVKGTHASNGNGMRIRAA